RPPDIHCQVAVVVRRGQDDGGRALAQLVGNGERVEHQEVVADLDRVRRYERGPPLLLVPAGMRRLPVPDPGAQFMHARDPMSAGMTKTNRTDSFVAAVGEPTLQPRPGCRGCPRGSAAPCPSPGGGGGARGSEGRIATASPRHLRTGKITRLVCQLFGHQLPSAQPVSPGAEPTLRLTGLPLPLGRSGLRLRLLPALAAVPAPPVPVSTLNGYGVPAPVTGAGVATA